MEPGRSAKTCDRPVLHSLLNFCSKKRNRIDVVVVHKFDRLSRSRDDIGFLKVTLSSSGVTVESATEEVEDSPEGKLMVGILGQFAEFENERRGQRSRSEMVTLAELGYWCHKAPVGYLNGRNAENRPILIEDPERGPLVRKAFDLVANRGYGQRAALTEVTKEGLVGAHGKPILYQKFNEMLTNAIYAGRISCSLTQGKTVQGRFQPLIDPDTFDRLQAVIANNGRKNVRQVRDNEEFPLRNWIRCGVCGGPLTASTSRGRGGKRYSYYHCYNKDCRKVHVPVPQFNKEYTEFIRGIFSKITPMYGLLRKILRDWWGQRQAGQAETQKRVEARLAQLDDKKSRLVDLLIDGKIEDGVYNRKKSEIDAQISLLKCDAHVEIAPALGVDDLWISAKAVLENANSLWERLDLENKRRFARILFNSELSYDGCFRTALNHPIVTTCDKISGGNHRMAPPTGFEPVLQG